MDGREIGLSLHVVWIRWYGIITSEGLPAPAPASAPASSSFVSGVMRQREKGSLSGDLVAN